MITCAGSRRDRFSRRPVRLRTSSSRSRLNRVDNTPSPMWSVNRPHDRDTDSNRIYGGFEVQSQTRLSGRAVGGVRLFRPKNAAKWSDRSGPYVDVNLAYRFCHDRGRAEEMAQEAFLRAYRGLERWRKDAAFSTWLFALATNLYCSELRRIPASR